MVRFLSQLHSFFSKMKVKVKVDEVNLFSSHLLPPTSSRVSLAKGDAGSSYWGRTI